MRITDKERVYTQSIRVNFDMCERRNAKSPIFRSLSMRMLVLMISGPLPHVD